MFELSNVSVSYNKKNIVSAVNLTIKPGEIHALMGPNGSGKSTLSLAIVGHPQYTISRQSKIKLNQQDILSIDPYQRAQAGVFLTFQNPVAIPGLSIKHMLKTMRDHLELPKTTTKDFIAALKKYAHMVGLPYEALDRSIHDGFSGGEKKRIEMLSLLVAEPKVAILDEIDSGLDVDAIKIISQTIQYAKKEWQTSFLVVTHYRRILDHIKPDYAHILVKGKLVKSGKQQLIDQIERDGYAQFNQ